MYLAWNCEDLHESLFAAEYMMNPEGLGYFSMIDRAVTFNIMGKFWSDIAAAMNNLENYNSGIIKLCRFGNSGGLLNTYFQWQAVVVGSSQELTIRFGYGDGSSFSAAGSHVYTYDQFLSMSDSDKTISIVYCKVRNNFTEAASPGYSGWIYYHLICGDINKCVGKWTDPSTQYPYGHMTYTVVGAGLLSDVPGGTIMCYADNAESRSMQSELVGLPITSNHVQLISSDSAFHACAADGSYNDDPLLPDPNADDPDGPSKPGGGDGNHSKKTEAVTLPDLPALGALDAGMITLYRLTGPEMSSFTSELWTFWSAVKAFFADPLDFVIGCMIVPFTPSSTRKAKPKFGADVWNTAFDVISEQFYSISCGTIDIEKYYGSCFDYDPYHKLEIYIPYVGYRELPVDQVMGKTIELTYHIDCMTGDFVAFVHTPVVGPTGPQLAQIICQFAGTMGVHVPLSRESFDATVSAGINLLGGAVGMAAGGIAQAAGLEGGDLKANQIASQASAATVSAVNSGKRNVIRSGSIGASSGMLAKQNPFIISTLPRQSLPENYKDLEGYPSNIYGTVGSFPGYLAVETIKLNVTATSAEKEMIMQMLKGGVFV